MTVVDLGAVRARYAAYETGANNRRVHSRIPTATQLDPGLRALSWARFPDPFDFEILCAQDASGDARALASWLARTDQPLPVHWAERAALARRVPGLSIEEDGAVAMSSSPRTLVCGPRSGDLPRRCDLLAAFVVKTHLGQESYDSFQGAHPGARELPRNVVLMAVILDRVLTQLCAAEPRLSIQRESVGITVRGGAEAGGTELGAIFRSLPPEPFVPGFTLASPTTLRLPHEEEIAPAPEPRLLARVAVEIACARTAGLGQLDAFVQLLVDPVLESYFFFASHGFGAPLHGQNILFRFDPDSGATAGVSVRDLNGFTYCAPYRRRRGMTDLLTVDRITPAFPTATQDDLDRWLTHSGEPQRRFTEPDIFRYPLDMYVGSLFFQLLASALETEWLGEAEIDSLCARIGDRVRHHAERADFDLDRLDADIPAEDRRDFWFAFFDEDGIANEQASPTRPRVIFR